MILRFRRACFCVTLATATILIAIQAPAVSAASPVQAAITAHMRAYPGATQIGPTEISYGHGGFVITFAPPALGVLGPDCPSESFCFYDNRDFVYPRGRLSDCGWQDLSRYGWHDRTESAHANIRRGKVEFLNHGSIPSHSSDVWLFTIYAGQAVPDTKPRNTADHVVRHC